MQEWIYLNGGAGMERAPSCHGKGGCKGRGANLLSKSFFNSENNNTPEPPERQYFHLLQNTAVDQRLYSAPQPRGNEHPALPNRARSLPENISRHH